jgi:hypothetical protein
VIRVIRGLKNYLAKVLAKEKFFRFSICILTPIPSCDMILATVKDFGDSKNGKRAPQPRNSDWLGHTSIADGTPNDAHRVG